MFPDWFSTLKASEDLVSDVLNPTNRADKVVRAIIALYALRWGQLNNDNNEGLVIQDVSDSSLSDPESAFNKLTEDFPTIDLTP